MTRTIDPPTAPKEAPKGSARRIALVAGALYLIGVEDRRRHCIRAADPSPRRARVTERAQLAPRMAGRTSELLLGVRVDVQRLAFLPSQHGLDQGLALQLCGCFTVDARIPRTVESTGDALGQPGVHQRPPRKGRERALGGTLVYPATDVARRGRTAKRPARPSLW
jgi:hypothetical protein